MVFKELEIQGFKSFPIRSGYASTRASPASSAPTARASPICRTRCGGCWARPAPASFALPERWRTSSSAAPAAGEPWVCHGAPDAGQQRPHAGHRRRRSRHRPQILLPGESEYTINGQLCRLKDIYELLLDTGIGRDGYSVIGQGRIAEIVAAKSSERREIFEEACGIAKYRYRKNEAERRLAAAAENLERLRDILDELEARVGPLEKESEKAQRFLELSARRKTLEVTLWTDGVHRAREAVRRQVRDYETAQAEYERFDREARAAEAEAEKIRMQAQQLTIAVERLNGDIRSITEELSGSDSRIAVLENDIARNEESAAALREDIAAGEQDSTEAAAALERHRAVARSMAAAGEKLAAELAELDAELLRLTSENNASGAAGTSCGLRWPT